MSKELQDKADQIIKELQDALVPLKEELKNQKTGTKSLYPKEMR